MTPPPKVVKVEPAPKQKKPTIPHIALPAKLTVQVYKAGRKVNAVQMVCSAVEQTVGKSMGRSAAGATAALQSHVYQSLKDQENAQVTLFPRTMGYVIAQGLANNKSADAVLVSLFKNGKMAKMAEANWKP